jgi:hypothetical protein
MILQITQMEHLGKGIYSLSFNDGKTGKINSALLADDEPVAVFSQFKNEDFICRARLNHGTLEWPNELDIAPEYLYFLAFKNSPELHETFSSWGYL